MPRVIVNSTPLIVLSNINQLDLLKKLYSEIYIPEAVFNEVTPLMNQLISNGFYITNEIFDLVKSEAGE